jgi:uncharacterized repeat protein (TIGR01451 family)
VDYNQQPPVAVNDSDLANPPGPATLSVTGNDTDPNNDLLVNTVDLNPGLAGQQTTLVVSGEGTWSVDGLGNVTFTPTGGFTGDPTPIPYTVSDATGLVSNQATITIDYVPVASNDSSSGNTTGSPVTVPVLGNDTTGDTVVPATVDLNPGSPGQQTTLVVPGEGTWTANPTTGEITFTPESGFTGDPTPIQYTVQDNDGNTSNPATVTVDYNQQPPVAVNDSDLANPPGPATLSVTGNDTDPNNDLLVNTVDLNPGLAGQQTTLVVSGEGTWSVDGLGNVTFTPTGGFTGDPTPIPYTISDATGLVSNQATITIDYVPVASNDSSSGNTTGSPVTVPVLGNDTTGDTVVPATVDLNPGSPGQQTTLVVPGEGTWTANPTTGEITFTPESGFTGDPTPIQYTVQDNDGNTSNPATVTVDYNQQPPVAVNDSDLANPPGPATLSVTGNDSDPNNDLLVGTLDLNPGLAGQQTTLVVSGEGTWSVDGLGNVTFTPTGGFTGDPTPIPYTVSDATGLVSNQATITIDYVPVASNDSSSGNTTGSPVTVPVLGNDTTGDTVVPATVDLNPGSPGQQTTLVVPGEGTWTANPTTGEITFTPESGFTGDPTPIQYTVQDNDGNTSNPATVTVDYNQQPPVAVNDSDLANPPGPATLSVTGNDTDPNNDLLVNTVDLNPGLAGQQTTLVVSGEGTWSVDGLGNVTFTPTGGFTGDPTPIPYTVSDATGLVSNQATITIDYVPVASNDSSSGNTTGSPVTVPVLGNDTTGDTVVPATVDLNPGSPGQQTTLVVPGEGTWTANPTTGEITFTPESGFTGDPTPIQYTMQDNDGNTSNPATVTVDYNQQPPVAVNDSDLANPPGPATLSVTGNDTDPNNDLLVNTVDLNPGLAGQQTTLVVSGEGTWSVDGLGNVTFTPTGGFTGDPTPIPYTVSDATGLVSNQATITIDYVPVASNDSSSGNTTGSPVTVPVLGNDTTGDTVVPATVDLNPGSPGQQTTLVVPGEGTWTANPTTGEITFTPESGFTGDPTPIQYTVQDNDGNTSNPATVTVDYNQQPPVAVNDSDLANPPGPATLSVTGNDTDPNNDLLVNTVDLNPGLAGQQTTLVVSGEGTWSVDGLGNVTFTPTGGFTGDPTPIPYTVSDATGLVSNQATITIDYVPVASNDSSSGNTTGSPVTVPVLGNDTTGDTVVPATVDLNPGSPGQQTTLVVPGEGTWTANPTTGEITFTPESGFTGDPTPIQYTVQDNDGNTSNPATVTVDYNQQPPVAVNDSDLANPPGPATLSVTGNDTDPNNDLLVNTVDLNPGLAGQQTTLVVSGEGTWSVDGLGNVTFTPTGGFTGDPTPIPYTISDATGLVSNQATITIDYVPVASNDSSSGNTTGSPVTVPVLGNDTTGDTVVPATVDLNPGSPGQQTTLVVPGEGTWTANPTTGEITFTPESGFTGDPTPIQYTVQDNDGNTSNPATVTVDYNQQPPVAVNDSDLANPPGPATLSVTGNDSDPNNDLLVGTVDLNPGLAGQQTTLVVSGEGTWSVDGLGNVTFTPTGGFTGDPTPIPYTVSDATGLVSNQATITIDYVPVASNDSSSGNTTGSPVTVPVLGNDTTGDTVVPATVDLNPGSPGQQTTLVVPGEGTWTANPTTGEITFTPESGFTGDPTPIQYTVQDNDGNTSNPATVTVDYNQQPPVAVNDSDLANPPGPATLSVTGNDTDPNNDLLVNTVDLNPGLAGQQTTLVVSGEGTWSVDGLGNVTFTPTGGFTGDPTPIPYTVSDATGLVSNQATITIDYVPVASNDSSSGNTTGSPVTVPVLGNDTTGDTVVPATVDLNPGSPGQQTTLVVPGEGTWTANPTTGEITFTPESGFTGDPTPIQYTVQDNDGSTSNPATVTVDYNQQPPVAVNDSDLANPPGPATLSVTGNDTDPNNDLLVNTVDLNPGLAGQQTTLVVSGEGTWSVDGLGNVTFTPTGGFTGDPTPIPYTVSDATGLVSNQATITIDYVPVASNDSSSGNTTGSPVTVPVLGNDTTGDTVVPATVDLNPGSPGQQTTLVVPGEGTWTANPTTGEITFTPESGFTGDPTPIQYTVQDNDGNTSNPATVTVDYNQQPPVAVNDSDLANPPGPATLSVTGNDTDPNNDLLVNTVDLNPGLAGQQTTLVVSGEGTWSVDGLGNVTFTPTGGFTGDPTPIPYTVSDATGLVSNQATITIDYVPVASNDSSSGNTTGSPVTVPVLGNDTTGDTVVPATVDLNPGSPGQQTTLVVPGEGTWTANPTTGEITFTPESGFTGDPTPIQYTVQDNDGNTSNPATVTVGYNNTTDADNDINQTPMNVPVSGNVLTNDSDLQGDSQTVTAALADTDGDGLANETLTVGVATPIFGTNDGGAIVAAGSLTLNANGTYTYVPASGFVGTVPAVYTITDSNVLPASDTATLTIEVLADRPLLNDPPVAQDDTNTTEENVPVTDSVLPNDSDPDGDPLTVVSALVATGVDGVVNDVLPLGVPTAIYGTDSDGNVVPAGTLTLNSGGTYTYTPAAGFTGTVPAVYTIEDPDGLSDSATLTITVEPNLGNATYANDDANTGLQGEPQSGNVLTQRQRSGRGRPGRNAGRHQRGRDAGHGAGGGDAADDHAERVPIGTLTLNPETGEYLWQPVADFVGTAVIAYTAADGLGATDTASLYLTTLAFNDTQADNDINQTPMNVTVSGNVLTNDSDLQGDSQTVTAALADTDGDGLANETLPVGVATPIFGTNDAGAIVAAGSLTLNATGTYTYVPASGFVGTVPAVYTITDNNVLPASDTATLTIEVIADRPLLNDPPVAQDDTNTTEENVPVSDSVLPNDSDPDGDPLTVVSALVATGVDGVVNDVLPLGVPTAIYGTDSDGNVVPAGTLTLNSGGTYTYTPAAGFTGTVPAVYTIEDPDGLSDSATLTITVEPNLGNATYANDDANTGLQGEPQTGNVLTNDNDPEGDDQDVTLVDTNGDGTPDTAPVAGTPLTITQNGVTIGQLTLNPETGEYLWQPVADFVGTAVIAYTAADDGTPQALDTATLYLTTLAAAPDLTVSKTEGGTTAVPGGVVSYTITYDNVGNLDATGVVLTETLPANSTFNAGASTAGWTFAGGSTYTFNVGAVPVSAPAGSVVFAVTVANPLPAGVTQLANSVVISDDGANGPDPTPDNNTGTDNTPVTAAPDLTVSKTEGGTTAVPGGVVSYTITYDNVGDQDATGVVLTETLPAHSVFNAGASTAGWTFAGGSTYTFTVGAVPVSAPAGSVVFAVTVANPLPAGVTQLANSVVVADDGTNGLDPTPGNNTGTDTTPVTAAPDLTVSKTEGGTTAVPGGVVSYTITYDNVGDQDATGVVLTETLPAHSVFNAGASTAGWTFAGGSTYTFTVGSVPVSAPAGSVVFAVTVANPLAAGVTQIANSVVVADDGTNGPDPTPGNNTGTDTTPVTAAPDLTVSKTEGGTTAVPGGVVSYTITYDNVGNQDATGVVLTETLPAHSVFNAGASTAGWTFAGGSTYTFTVGSVPVSEPAGSVVFAVTVANPLPAGVTQLANSVVISDDGTNGLDPTPSNNTGTDTTPVTAAPDLTVSKTEGGGTAVPGGAVSYTITYDNVGNQDATGVVLTETLPAHSVFNAGASTAGWTFAGGSTYTFTVGAVPVSAPAGSVVFAVTVANPLAAGVMQLANSVVVADDGTNGPDPTPGNNTGTDTTPITAAPNLIVGKSDGGVTAIPGQTVTYTITYQNTGNQADTNVILTETLGANVTFNDPATTAAWVWQGGGVYTLNVGTVSPSDGPLTVDFAVTIDDPLAAGQTQTVNTVSIVGAEDNTPSTGTDTTPIASSSLAGVVFNDLDGNGNLDTGEPGTNGVTVYLDLNNNGALDAGEPTRITNSNGQYTFAGLVPGTYLVRELWPHGTIQTTTPNNGALTEILTVGENATGLNFGNQSVVPTVLDDGDPGFSIVSGAWETSYCSVFVDSDARYTCTTGGNSVIQWQFANLIPGAIYRVSTTWMASSTFSSDTPFTVAGGAAPVTLDINQKAWPSAYADSFTAGGITWKDIAPAYTITGNTLTVQMSNATSGGCAVGDAVRIVRLTTPEISVLDGGATLTDGSTTPLDLGGSPQGVTWTRDFTIRNNGGAPLQLGTLTVPFGFSVATGLGTATLAPGAQTTFRLQFNALQNGATYEGDIVIGNNDNNEAPFNFRIRASVGADLTQASQDPTPPLPAPPSGFATPINITDLSTNTLLLNALSSVAYGTYQGSANVARQYQISNPGTSSFTVGSIDAPSGFTVNGLSPPVTVNPGSTATFSVAFAALTAGSYAGDVEMRNSEGDLLFTFTVTGEVTSGLPPLTAPRYVDNGTSGVGGYTDTAGFARLTGTGYLGDYEQANGDNSNDFAQWEFPNLPAGTFTVATRWYQRSTRTTAAQYQVFVNGTPSGTYTVNQRLAPNGFSDQSMWWNYLGTTISLPDNATLTVRLTDQVPANEVGRTVSADAVRVEQVSSLLADASAAGVTGAEGTTLDAVPTSLVQQAAALWLAAEPQSTDRLANVQVIVADLPAGVLGLAAMHSQTVWVDVDADGQGWFVDTTPWADEEFEADTRGQLVGSTWASRGGVDLLTVLAHELGHLLGHEDDYDDSDLSVMEFALPPGVRRLPLPAAGIRSDGRSIPENSVVEAPWLPLAEVRRGIAERRDAAGTRIDAGLTALLAEQPGAWAPADEELARLTVAPRKRADDPEQQLDDVMSSVGDWLDPLEEVLGLVKPSR